MAFSLKRVIDGQQKVFLLQKILEVLGDPTNDEILLDGQAYRISSFMALNGGSGSGINSLWLEQKLNVEQNNQQLFDIGNPIDELNSALLFINGVFYPHGMEESFHINNTQLHWHGDFSLDTNDKIILKFRKTI